MRNASGISPPVHRGNKPMAAAFTIALIGNDGTGKTTNRNLLIKSLRAFGIPVDVIPGFDHLLIQIIKRMVASISSPSMSRLQSSYSMGRNRNSGNHRTRILFRLWPYLVFIDCLCIWIFIRLKRGKLVLFDRYFYDYAISFRELGYSSSFVERLFLSLPKPDIGFVFDAAPEIAYQRKKHDHAANPDYYRRQRSRYLNLAGIKAFLVIDTSSRPPNESQRILLDSILEHPKFKQYSHITCHR